MVMNTIIVRWVWVNIVVVFKVMLLVEEDKNLYLDIYLLLFY